MTEQSVPSASGDCERSPPSTRSQRLLKMLVRAAVSVTVVVVAAQLWTFDLGFGERIVDGARVVSELDPGGAAERAGIAVGDEIVADPGGEVAVAERTEREAYAASYRLGRAMRQGAVPVRIRRGQEERTVTIAPRPGPSLAAALRQLERLGLELPVAFAFLAIAVVLSRRPSRSPRDERARSDVAAACALLGVAWVDAWPAPGWPTWLYPVAIVLEVFGTAVGAVFLTRFAWSYPTRATLVDRPTVRLAVLGVGLPCTAFSVLNTLHVVGAPDGLRGNTANIAFTGALGLAMLAGLAWQRRRAVDLVAKRQASWLLAFCGVGVSVPTALLLVPHYGFGVAVSPVVQGLLLAFPLLVPIGFAAVVSRYRLFALDGGAAVPYAIALVTSAIVFLAVTLGVDAVLASHAQATGPARWLGTLAALALVEPLRRASQVLLDRAFSRDREGFVRRAAELAARLAPMSDTHAIEEEVKRTMDAKTVRFVSPAEVLDRDAARAVDEELGAAGALRVVELRDPSSVDALRARGFELLVAIPSPRSHGASQVLALMLPGGARALGRAERAALAMVGRVIGAALARDVAWRLLETEVERANHDRRHIAMELHDGVGSTLSAARSMARRLRAHASEQDARTLDALEETLTEGLGDLRASLTGVDPADAEWEAVVATLRRHVTEHCAAEGVAVTFESAGEGARRLTSAGRLTVLRVVREAVTNAVKHGAPRNVRVRMELDTSAVTVLVEDDGSGASGGDVGRGLGYMERRVEGLAGELRVERVDPHGTRVVMVVPASALVLATLEGAERA